MTTDELIKKLIKRIDELQTRIAKLEEEMKYKASLYHTH